jgi:4a-hydroxytetrahydrobiopterin dehydratase
MTSDLTSQHCAACTAETPRLSSDEVSRLLPQVDGYALEADGRGIHRAYRFKDYYETMAFVNAVAWIAHREDHHPELQVSYAGVRVHYSTHATGGVSMNDFICAAKINRLISG